MLTTKQLPIGVFDSGVGGLTVLHALQQQLPNESFIYLGDTARLPYGTKSPETVINYSLKASQQLIERGIKCLVVACNTASTIALPALQKTHPNIPVIGVVKPGAENALTASQNKVIAVIATEATVRALGYTQAIQALDPKAQVIAKSCSLFVALAEEGWTEGPIAESIAQEYLASLIKSNQHDKPDTLILGCTHFPILKNTIKKVIGDHCKIIDSALATAEATQKLLQQQQLIKTDKTKPDATQFLVTDCPERFLHIASRFLNDTVPLSQVELIDNGYYTNNNALSPNEQRA
jgi:glutamate racemase